MHYNPKIVLAFFTQSGIPKPELEYKFHPTRKWRFDFAWTAQVEDQYGGFEPRLALEVQGGIWTAGRHNRGAALLKEWEKLNEAAVQGWRIIYCQPKDLLTKQTIELLEQALGL